MSPSQALLLPYGAVMSVSLRAVCLAHVNKFRVIDTYCYKYVL